MEITECQPLPDGRFYLEIVGRRRFAPMDTTEQVSLTKLHSPWLSGLATTEQVAGFITLVS